MNVLSKRIFTSLLSAFCLFFALTAFAGGTAKSRISGLPLPPAVAPTPTFSGFFLGPEGGWVFATDKTKGDIVSTIVAPTVISYDRKLFQNGGLVGGVVGFGKQFTNRGYIGLAFHGLYSFANKTTKTIGSIIVVDPSDSNIIKKTFDLKYFVTAVITPGVVLTHHLLAYLNIGAAWARMQFGTTFTPVGPVVVLPSVTQNKNRFGFVGGVGLKWKVLKYFSLFAEYNYYNFGKFSLGNVAMTPEVTISGQTNRVHFSTVTAGAAFDFNL